MLARSLGSILTALLLAFLFTLQALSTILSGLRSYPGSFFAAKPLRFARSRRGMPIGFQAGEEFAFERAIEAYERLIDAAYAQRRA